MYSPIDSELPDCTGLSDALTSVLGRKEEEGPESAVDMLMVGRSRSKGVAKFYKVTDISPMALL